MKEMRKKIWMKEMNVNEIDKYEEIYKKKVRENY